MAAWMKKGKSLEHLEILVYHVNNPYSVGI